MMCTTGLVVKSFDHFYYVVVGRQDVQSLDFFQFLYFLQGIELFLHAFNGNVFAAFEGQRSEDHRERTAAFFELKFVLVHVFINKKYNETELIYLLITLKSSTPEREPYRCSIS